MASFSSRCIHLSRPSRAFVTSPRRAVSTSAAPPHSYLRTGVYTAALTVSAGLFAVYYFDARSALHRYFLTPILRNTLDAETGQKVAIKVLRSGLGPRDPLPDDDILGVELWGQRLSNPVGLAAGFDKNGEAIDGLFNLGFSWVEIGSITPKPQAGNPRPRVFHLPSDSALINRYGFPSFGHAAVLSRLSARAAGGSPTPPGALLAVNLGKNKDSPVESLDDFVTGARLFAPHADVLVVNVSSPNTPGLRGLQTRRMLDRLLAEVNAARSAAATATHRPKLVLKIAPDLERAELLDVAAAIRAGGVDGVIVSNTTIARPASLSHPNKVETGGLSGPPLKPLSLAALRILRSSLPPDIVLIGCGGIASGADALDYARAGASFVQIYTSFGYAGAGACRRIKDEIAAELRREGTTWDALVNKAVAEHADKGAGAGGIGQLIEEAEHLKSLVDKLATQMV